MSRDAVRGRDRAPDGCAGEHGYCFWAVERRADGAFLGFCGLKPRCRDDADRGRDRDRLAAGA